MNLNQLYHKTCCVMQWNIGFCMADIAQVIREKKTSLSFKWMPLGNGSTSVADPFIIKGPSGQLTLFYEDFSMTDLTRYGKIIAANVDNEFAVTGNKMILDAGSHSSYPFIFVENGVTYIIPETSEQRKVAAFEYDFKNKCLVNERVLIGNLPLLDSTIFKHYNKYWLFATLGEHGYDHSQLHIYYADNLFGPYKPNANNPVKNNLDGSRPAGNLIEVDGEIYRPAQNCAQHYGESISINKITRLSENEFTEELFFKLTPDKSSAFNSGVHTINSFDGIIVIDGIKMLFRPFTKWSLFIKKKFKKANHSSS